MSAKKRKISQEFKLWDDFITWEEYFMNLAILASKRSKDQQCRVGACIVNDTNQIVGTGYNGMPVIFEKEGEEKGDNDLKFTWEKVIGDYKRNKHFYVCHAEMNAIAFKTSVDVAGCTLYTTLFPCNKCAQLIAQSRIKKVIYLPDSEKEKKEEFMAGRKILETVGVELKIYDGETRIEIKKNVDNNGYLK